MKVIILAGGLGTRISEETERIPKPMIQIGDKPILWHLMNFFNIQGFDNFVIAGGYKIDVIESWISTLKNDWNISLLDTGLNSNTAQRIQLCLDRKETCFVAYGDGFSNLNLHKFVNFHKQHGKLATLMATRPPARFGYLEINNEHEVNTFEEKNQLNEGWINGGYFVLEPGVHPIFTNLDESFELTTLPALAKIKQLNAYRHEGFWQCMDNRRDKDFLNKIYLSSEGSQPPWLQII